MNLVASAAVQPPRFLGDSFALVGLPHGPCRYGPISHIENRLFVPRNCNINRTDLRMPWTCSHRRDGLFLYNGFWLRLKSRDLGASLTKWPKLLSIVTLRFFVLQLRDLFFWSRLQICDSGMYNMRWCEQDYSKMYGIILKILIPCY